MRPLLSRSSAASPTMATRTASTPRSITAFLSAPGVVINRVSMSTRADSPGCAPTFRSVKMPPTCGFFSGGRVPASPGIPIKSAPAPPVSAQICSALQPPAAIVERAATAATESRNATTTVSWLARTNSPALPVSTPPAGSVDSTRPPLAGSVAMAEQGIEMSSARGAPDTRGAVIWVMLPSAVLPCGQKMVAVVWFTGSSGTMPHSSRPAIPETTAARRAIR
ncbi:Uncharacterised protein [Mycobacterium tuberculosis]|nr:Uncharacterised protein [Mycobacterium tuberculosis]